MSIDLPGGLGGGPATAVFCGACGVRLEGARFCTSCGRDSATAAAGSTTTPFALTEVAIPASPASPASPVWPASVAAAAPPAGASRTPLVVAVIAATVVLVLVGASGLALALKSRVDATHKPHEMFRRNVTSALGPVSAATSTLATQVTELRAQTPLSGPRGGLRATSRAVRVAQEALAALQPSSAADRNLVADARAALAAELAWLTVARAGLRHPENGQMFQLSSLELEAKTRLTALAADAALAAPVFPRSAPLVRYVTARTQAARPTAAGAIRSR